MDIMTRLAVAAALLMTIFGGVLVFSNHHEKHDDNSQMKLNTCSQFCPDGSKLLQSGAVCDISMCPKESVPNDITEQINSLSDKIVIHNPEPGSYIKSPLVIEGEARGQWFFEGDFPVILTDWNGEIIAEYFATAQSEWMTEDFVSFASTLEFSSPYQEGLEASRRGWLILQRDNPKDGTTIKALEIPVWFSE